MGAAPFSLEGCLEYISETFAARVIQSYQGQVQPDDAEPLSEYGC